jgi:glycosyltransferase involved in cell wall biosynthesis
MDVASKEKKKALFFSQSGTVGGAERSLAVSIHNLTFKGLDISVCLTHRNIGRYRHLLEDAGARVFFLDMQLAYERVHHIKQAYKAFKLLNRLFEQVRPDVVILEKVAIHFEFSLISFFVSCKNLFASKKLKLVSIEHFHNDDWPVYPPRKYFPKNLHIRQEVEKIFCALTMRLSDLIIRMNQLAVTKAVENFDYPKERTTYLYNGIDCDKFKFSQSTRDKLRG